jgi:multiple sugar transport system substrate-binding protein
MDRRGFLRLAGGAAAMAAVGTGCGSGSDRSDVGGATTGSGPGGRERTLRIAQWSAAAAGLPAYDEWYDNQYTQRWGDEHDVRVVVEHLPLAELSGRAEAEAAAQAGHDIFGFTSSPAALEDQVIDHRELVEEVEAKLGKATPLVERSVLNPATGKYFAFPEFWTPQPVHYRVDLWEAVAPGTNPATWDDVLRAAPRLRASGHPVGIGLSQDPESTWSLLALMHAYGSSIQDEQAELAIGNAATVEAVKVAAAIFKAGMTDEVFGWDAVANNRLLASGKGSLILNGISAMRSVEVQDPALASKIGLLPTLAGPAGAQGSYLMGVSVIWKFARNPDLARQFLIDLALNYRHAFVQSEFYKMPAFPGAVADLKALVTEDRRAQPPGKYALLTDAAGWSTNLGHPGHTNAAVEEVLNRHLIPKMFSAAARGQVSPAEAVAAAEAEMRPIFDKWRERGKI